jgi:hypothetical protein
MLIALVVSLLALGASTALANTSVGSESAPIYGPNVFATGVTCPSGAFPTTTTFGSVVLNTPDSKTTLKGQVTLLGARPNATFGVADQQNPGNCFNLTPIGTMTTNSQGNGTFNFSVPRIPSATAFWVGVATGITTSDQILGSSAVALH